LKDRKRKENGTSPHKGGLKDPGEKDASEDPIRPCKLGGDKQHDGGKTRKEDS